jgi:hypothetical protein
MIVTKDLVEAAGGKRSSFVRHALAQAGDKRRLVALVEMSASTGLCEITTADVERLWLRPVRKKFSFCRPAMDFVMLAPDIFSTFPHINNQHELQEALFRHGVLGWRDFGISE